MFMSTKSINYHQRFALDIVDWSYTTSYPSLSFFISNCLGVKYLFPSNIPSQARSIHSDARNELEIWISCVFVQELGLLILRIILVASTNSKIVYFLFTLTCASNPTCLVKKYEKKSLNIKRERVSSLPLNGSEEIQESNSKNFLWMKLEKRETKKKTKEKKKMLSNGISHVCLLWLFALSMET